jgi:hypothetical protein
MQKTAEKRCQWLDFLACFLVVSVTVLSLCACKTEEAPPASRPADAEMMESEGVESEDVESEDTYSDAAEMAFEEILDSGQECRSHRYLLPSGAYETLEFSKLLHPNQQTRPTAFSVHTNELDGSGVSVSLDSVEYVSASRPYRIWAFDYSSYIGDYEAKIAQLRERDPGVRFETYPLQVVNVNGRRVDLNFDYANGRVIILRLGPLLSDKAVGKAPWEEIVEMLEFLGANASGELTFQDKFLGRKITVPLVEDTRDEELTFLTYSVSVATPEEGGIRDTRQRSIQYIPDSGSGQGIGVQVASSWGRDPDPNALFFNISGPAEYPDCY